MCCVRIFSSRDKFLVLLGLAVLAPVVLSIRLGIGFVVPFRTHLLSMYLYKPYSMTSLKICHVSAEFQ